MIAIIGGTFDPIHFGHLRPALEITEELKLEEMRFIPSAKPPHRWQPKASEAHRLAMVKLAVNKVEKFVVDDREYHRDGASFTVDTLKSLRLEIGETVPLCMVIGMDAFQSFTQWRNWQEILALTHLVISKRPGYEQDFDKNSKSDDWIKPRLVDSPEALHESSAGKLYFTNVTQFDISATEIRKHTQAGKSIQYLTPSSVCDYIQEHKLYL